MDACVVTVHTIVLLLHVYVVLLLVVVRYGDVFVVVV